MNHKWSLVYTKPNQENIAKRNLDCLGFFVFLPMIYHYELGSLEPIKKEPMFPRYIFINYQSDNQIHKVNSTRGVSNIVRFANNYSIYDIEFINEILLSTDDNGIIKHYAEKNVPVIGDNVTISSGPFSGNTAQLVSYKSSDRVIILMHFLNEKIRMDVDSIILK